MRLFVQVVGVLCVIVFAHIVELLSSSDLSSAAFRAGVLVSALVLLIALWAFVLDVLAECALSRTDKP